MILPNLIGGFCTAISILTPVYADVTCGVIDDVYHNGSRYRMTCDDFPGFYCECGNGFDDQDFSFDKVCVEYDYNDKNSNTIYMSNCKVVDRFCSANHFLNNDGTNSWCADCPTGLTAELDPDMMHLNTRCSYCAVGYYGSAPKCSSCPGSGTTKNADSTSVTDCYTKLPSGPQTDETGTFIHASDDLDCWWKN